MKDKNTPSLTHPEILFLSFFGVGFLPKAPGTWGSLAIVPVLYVLGIFKAPFFLFIPFLLVATTITCFIAEYTQKKNNIHDPSWIVMDEVLGMWTAWLFTHPNQVSFYSMALIFGLFRFFDIIKFWPASYFDKLEHGAGTILDDIVSGIFAGITFLVITHFVAIP
ncbi:MAG: phosphatidylglycerophosphatase A [Halobacteriovoraceae bacterium]|nr:phosphatidylglycerophosphatase A [Halobacteriovoraceae bacterium]MBC96201.1 phosphatidylglycerophosphatase A [Halobacteriovoraceae bacterium]|tara:strand:- start:125658 stop:126152 length:495 start_codon:yes stop_codon:yes gene_type:complete